MLPVWNVLYSNQSRHNGLILADQQFFSASFTGKKEGVAWTG